MKVQPPKVLSASELCSDPVTNVHGEHLGKMEEVMIDLERGRVAYCVISFGGKTMGRTNTLPCPGRPCRYLSTTGRLSLMSRKRR